MTYGPTSMHNFLILLAMVWLTATPLPSGIAHDDPKNKTNHDLLEIGPLPSAASKEPAREIKVVSYNIRWRSGDELRKMVELLKSDPEVGGATILGLQEVDRNRKRTGNKNTAKWIADQLGMHYAWAAPPTPKPNQEEETGVALISAYPMSDVERIVLPHEGPNKRRRVGLGATIKIGSTNVRVYSVHSETRMAEEKKLEQMKAVIKDLAGYPKDMPAIIMGDLNTWEPSVEDKTEKLFKSEGFHTPFDGDATFCRRILLVSLKLKLDWVWLRQLDYTASGIDKEIEFSDHWPLWLSVKFKN